MHEMSIVASILETVLQEAEKHHVNKVKSIKLRKANHGKLSLKLSSSATMSLRKGQSQMGLK